MNEFCVFKLFNSTTNLHGPKKITSQLILKRLFELKNLLNITDIIFHAFA